MPVFGADIDMLLRAALAVPAHRRRARVRLAIRLAARAAAVVPGDPGAVDPRWGAGTLGHVAHRLPRAPLPTVFDPDSLDALALVARTLREDHAFTPSRPDPF